MKSEVTLSIKLGLSVTVTCISTVSHDRLRFRNKLKLYRREDAPKFATQKMAAYGGSQRLNKENSFPSKMTHEVCISKQTRFISFLFLGSGSLWPKGSFSRRLFSVIMLIIVQWQSFLFVCFLPRSHVQKPPKSCPSFRTRRLIEKNMFSFLIYAFPNYKAEQASILEGRLSAQFLAAR